ncbi:MAG: hypothetical protein KatS3mg103_0146 [Phycisphaerales bacterium]|nr:MAG: hypothetical protein KatS3mg103_0146 [Phycisphaerales bacterium]
MLALLCLAWVGVQAHAQDASRQPGSVLLDFGFEGEVRGGRWCPARIIVGVHDEPIQAVARITVHTPRGGRLTTMVPLATTPGRETIVPTTLWLHPGTMWIDVALLDRRGRAIVSTTYGQLAGAHALPLPNIASTPVIVGVHSPSLRTLTRDASSDLSQSFLLEASRYTLRSEGRLERARIAQALPLRPQEPPWLAHTLMGYDMADVVVLDGQRVGMLEPTAIEALRQWVATGGRLVLAGCDNAALQRVLGPLRPAGVAFGAVDRQAVPESLGGPGEVPGRVPLYESLPAGWKPLAAAPGLGVHGPVGLGWALLLGIDPDSLAMQQGDPAARRAWRATLQTLYRLDINTIEQLEPRLASRMAWYGEPIEMTAQQMVYAWVTRMPEFGVGSFVVIFAMMIGLGLAIGPVDRMVLRRLGALHLWWMTCLGWIVLATIGSLILPTLVRSEPTRVRSLRIVDAIDPDGQGRPLAYEHAYVGIAFGQSTLLDLDDLEPTSWLSPMAVGTSLGDEPMLEMVPSGRVMRPGPTPARMWTSRAFEVRGPTEPSLRASARVHDGELVCTLTGRDASRVDWAYVHTGGSWYALEPRPDSSDARTRLIARLELPVLRSQTWTDPASGARSILMSDVWREPRFPQDGLLPPAFALMLDGVRAHDPVMLALGEDPGWAVLYATFENDRTPIGGRLNADRRTQWVYRYAMPLRPASGGEPAP